MPAADALPAALDRKYRQAAVFYLHVGILYEVAAFAAWRRGFTGHVPGNPALWFVLGGGIVALVVWGLWTRRNPWIPRAVWAIHALRLPTLVDGAFLRPAGSGLLPPSFYLVALAVVLANLWMLARAGWDL